ncbi:MAG: metallophosphoesterase [Usitatibacter sp.]
MTLRLTPIALLVALLHVYIGARLLPGLDLAGQLAGGALLVGCFWLLPKGWHARDDARPWKVLVPWIATGFFSWLLVLTLLRELTLLAALVALDAATRAQWARISALGILVATPLITIAGFVMARKVARVVEVDVPLSGLPRELHGFTIAQISDIHVGPTIKRAFVERIVARVNLLEADMVAITGDLVDGSVRELAHHTEPLGNLASRHGTYVVTGNHEYYSGANAWITELRRLGARVLMNEHVLLDHDGAALAVAGVTDYSAHHFDPSHRSDAPAAMQGVPRDAVKVLLAHQPRSAAGASAVGFDLQLSGHTHGGQFWPWNLFVRLQQPFTAGLNRLGKMWIYISRGTGYWGPPMRFGIPSEITRIRLVPG